MSFTALRPSVEELDRHISAKVCFQRGQTYLVKVVKVVLAVAAARVGSSGSLVVSKTIAPAYVSRMSDKYQDNTVTARTVVLSNGSEQATVLLLESISEVLGGSSDVVVDIKAVNT